MMIVKEHYRDFIGTINTRRAELANEIEFLIDGDECKFMELQVAEEELHYLTSVQEFFMDTSRCAHFKSMELLEMYVNVIKSAYKSMDAYSKSVLPIDGGETIGVSQKEWNEIESTRYELLEKFGAWNLFAKFCKNGTIDDETDFDGLF